MNPLDLAGPQFLKLFFTLLPIAVMAGLILRVMVRRSVSGGWGRTETLDPFELALLAQGPTRAVQSAVVALVEQGVVKANGGGSFRVAGGLATDANKFKRQVHQLIAGSEPYFTQLMRRSSDALDEMDARLTAGGLLLPLGMRRLSSTMSMVPLACVLMLGIAKIGVGILRDRPVGFLVLGCLVTIIVGVLFWNNSARRTVAGDEMLKQHRRLREIKRPTSESDLPILVAMYGTGMLSGTRLASLQTQLAPPRNAGGGGWSGTGCGAGSCGGGSSCGGGGGGCGGCGGGH